MTELKPTEGHRHVPRIAQVISVIAESYGGPSSVALDLNVALKRAGIEAVVLTTDRSREGGRLSRAELQRIRSTTGATLRVFRSSSPAAIQNSWGLASAMWSAAKSADLLHFDGQYMAAHIFGYIAARAHRTPYGMQPHGTLDEYQLRQSARKKWLYNRLIGDRFLRNALYVLFTSESEAKASVGKVRPEQVRIAPLGVSDLSQVPLPSVTDYLDGHPRGDTVLYLGRLARKKRPDMLLASWSTVVATLPDARLIIAGPDDEWTQAELTKLLEPHLRHSVHFTGRVTRSEATWLYRQAGVFVLPSENENFALTVAEALAAGCQVVTTTATSASAYVDETQGVVLDFADAPALAEAICLCISRLSSGIPDPANDAPSWTKAIQVLKDAATQNHP